VRERIGWSLKQVLPLLEAMRNGTVHLHDRLDRSISRVPVATHEGYVRFLGLQAAVLPGLENWLCQTEDYRTIPSYRNRLRSSELLQDLKTLGCLLPARHDLQLPGDRASVAGVCYVLEGSRLGASYICSQLRQADAGLPVNFLQHGKGQGYWKSFLSWLAALETTRHERSRAVSAARNVFEAYLQVLRTENDEVKAVGKTRPYQL
jgi:heme oxygenase